MKLLNALGVGMVLVILFKTMFGILRHYLLAYVGRKVDQLPKPAHQNAHRISFCESM